MISVALGLLPIQLQHGVKLVSEVREHGADVVQDVPSVPSRLLHASVRLVQRAVGEANA